MTRDELLAIVPVREFHGRPFYVRVADIPEPWRQQFMHALRGSACPVIAGEGDCAHSHDWRAWVQDRWYFGRMGPTGLDGEAHPMTARDNEAAMLECCALIATGALEAPRTPAEANVCRVAGMILGRHLQAARQRLAQAAAVYFAAHPDEQLESAETVRRGWISNLPRLRDRLERRLREAGQGASP